MRENLMVTIKKAVENMEVCFNRTRPPQTLSRLLDFALT